jgi:hypothetical protein
LLFTKFGLPIQAEGLAHEAFGDSGQKETDGALNSPGTVLKDHGSFLLYESDDFVNSAVWGVLTAGCDEMGDNLVVDGTIFLQCSNENV